MKKVLIVDDSVDFRVLVKRMLVRLGAEVREADNGSKGQEIGLEWQPDLILLDLMMPVQDGFITCRNLRKEGYKGRIIIISALAGVWGDLQVSLSDADGFLAKPISMRVLEDCLNGVITTSVADLYTRL